jgi:alkaline phosphatase D
MVNRRQVLSGMLAGFAAQSVIAKTHPFTSNIDPGVFKIAFGSCVSQRKDQSILGRILAHEPQAFIMMGDGVYPEHEGADRPVLEQIEASYEQAATRDELRSFREQVPVIAMWDDNDYGGSDIGASFEHKRRSKELFLDFWTDKKEKEIRDRESGIYGLWNFGSEEHRTQIIVPDLRYCRSEWAHTEKSYKEMLSASGFGPYVATTADDVSMLGETQWAWLEECLREPARVRILVSTIQCIPEGRGWESWSNFPAEKTRLLNLIRDTKAEGLIILSGDSHYAEMSKLEDSIVGYPLWEATSSGLTEMWPLPGPNPHRVGPAYPQTNYGLVHINWVGDSPMIVFEIYAEDGLRLRQQSVMLDSLSIGT